MRRSGIWMMWQVEKTSFKGRRWCLRSWGRRYFKRRGLGRRFKQRAFGRSSLHTGAGTGWRNGRAADGRRDSGRSDQFYRAENAEEIAAMDSLESVKDYQADRKLIYENLRLFMPFYTYEQIVKDGNKVDPSHVLNKRRCLRSIRWMTVATELWHYPIRQFRI